MAVLSLAVIDWNILYASSTLEVVILMLLNSVIKYLLAISASLNPLSLQILMNLFPTSMLCAGMIGFLVFLPFSFLPEHNNEKSLLDMALLLPQKIRFNVDME